MKHCDSCGAEMPNFANFCGECGKPFTKEQVSLEQQRTRMVTITEQSNGAGTAGFIISIVSLFIGWFPIIGWIVLLLGGILCIIGCNRSKKGLAIAGLIISALNLLIVIGLYGAIGETITEISNLYK